jgi:MFS family permease
MNSFFQDIWARRIALWAFVPMMFIYAASYFQRTAVPGTVFNDLQADYGLTGTQIAGMGSAYICIYAICQLLVGICADKYGGMRVITYAGILFCIGALGFPLVCGSSTINLILMYFMRVLCGLGSSGMFLSLLRENDHLFGRKNFSVVLGIVYFIGYGGGLLGTMPFAMLKSHFHWNIILIAVGFLSFIIYLIFLLGKRAVPVEPVKAVPISFRPLLFVLKNPYTWCVAFNSAVCFCCYFVIQTVFGMKFLLDYAKLSENAASGTIFSLTLISMSTLLAGGILTRLMNNRRKPLIIFSCGTTLFSSILMLVSILFHLPPFCFAAAYCLFAFASGMSIAFSMLVQELNSKDIQTQSAAFLNMSGYLAVAIFSVLIGLLLDSFVDPSEFTGGKAVIYPTKAYATLFGLLLIPTITSFVISLFLPETKGHYVREDYSKQIGRS